MFFRLLLESFRRQRRRKLLAGAAILLGTTAVSAMLALATTIGDRIHRELAVYGANIIVTPISDALAVKIGDRDLRPAKGAAQIKEADLEKLRGIFWANNITGVSPQLTVHGSLQVATDGRPPVPAPAIGMWFEHDLKGLTTGASKLYPWWKLSGAWPVIQQARAQVAVGARLARQLDLKVGDTVTIEAPRAADGSSATQRWTAIVSGIVSSGDATDGQVLLPLSVAQTLNGTPEAVDRVDISARTRPEDAFARKDPDSLSPKQRDLWYCRPYANSIAYQIHEALPGAQAQQVRRVEQSEGAVLSRISGLMWLISAAALLAAGFAVSAAMATAILERRREIGLMRSLGASRSSIALLFYVESAILAVLAGSVGYLAGSGLSAWLGARIFSTGGAAGPAAINLVLLPVILALALLVAVAGSTPSIRSALRLDPSQVLRADA